MDSSLVTVDEKGEKARPTVGLARPSASVHSPELRGSMLPITQVWSVAPCRARPADNSVDLLLKITAKSLIIYRLAYLLIKLSYDFMTF